MVEEIRDSENMNALEAAYAHTRVMTLDAWAEHEGTGAPVAPKFDKHLLGIAVGGRFTPCGWVLQLHHLLEEYAKSDPLLDVVPADCLHFTFLALATSQFEAAGDVPDEFQCVRAAYQELVSSLTFRVHRLRLHPLKNALLLAGIPDEASFQTRERLADRLLSGPWERHLRARYEGFQIPPPLWHSTFARYEADYLPPEVRDLYHAYAGQQIETVELGTPILAAHNYNWTRFAAL